MGVAVVLAAQVPTWIAGLPDPYVRAGVGSVVLLVALWLAYRANPPGGAPPSAPVAMVSPDPVTGRETPSAKGRGGTWGLVSRGVA